MYDPSALALSSFFSSTGPSVDMVSAPHTLWLFLYYKGYIYLQFCCLHVCMCVQFITVFVHLDL